MTDKEKAVIMAYTGTTFLAGDKFGIFHKYIEDIMGRPVFTHELGDPKIASKIKEKALPDFLKICKDEFEEDQEVIKENSKRYVEVNEIYLVPKKDIKKAVKFKLAPCDDIKMSDLCATCKHYHNGEMTYNCKAFITPEFACYDEEDQE